MFTVVQADWHAEQDSGLPALQQLSQGPTCWFFLISKLFSALAGALMNGNIPSNPIARALSFPTVMLSKLVSVRIGNLKALSPHSKIPLPKMSVPFPPIADA